MDNQNIGMEGNSPAVYTPTTAIPPSNGMPGAKLPGPIAILRQAWEIYKSRFGLLLGITLLPSGLLLVYFLLVGGGVIAGSFLTPQLGSTAGGATVIAGIILAVLLYIALIYVGIWAQTALILAIKGADQKVGFKQSFGQASHKIGSFFGASLLVGMAVSGMALLFEVPGFLLFYSVLLKFLLPFYQYLLFIIGALAFILIIPAIIIGVRYSLSAFVVVGDNTKALSAVKRSRDYVSGYWWPVFWRFLFIGVIAIIFTIIIFIITAFLTTALKGVAGSVGTIIGSIINLALSVILPPLYITYGYEVYTNLKAIKGESQIPADKSSGVVWIIIVVVILVIAIAGVSIVLLSLNSARSKSRDAKRLADARQISAALELYFNDNNAYPNTLSQLVPTDIGVLPVAPEPADGACTSSENQYQYQQVSTNDYKFTFCTGASVGGYSAGMHTMTTQGIDSGSNNLENFNFPNSIPQNTTAPASQSNLGSSLNSIQNSNGSR